MEEQRAIIPAFTYMTALQLNRRAGRRESVTEFESRTRAPKGLPRGATSPERRGWR